MKKVRYKEENREDESPSFYRRKLFIVGMLLLLTGIIAVVASYAWFILATAPEITGISATIGSNGSLEMALLDDTTYENTTLIGANVGDSMDVVGKSKAEANITWGNLVDLSDTTYGLSSIVLYPSLLNLDSNNVNLEHFLSVPHNGTDGRITRLTADTATAKYDGTVFSIESDGYGVRAIGQAGVSGSNRGSAFSSAKSSFNANKSTAKSAAINALTSNGSIFLSLALSDEDTFTYEDVSAMKSLVSELDNSLNYVYSAYKKAVLASSASKSEEAYAAVSAGIGTADDPTLSNYVNHFPAGMTPADLTDLATALSSAKIALNACNALLFDENGDERDSSTVYTEDQVMAILNALITTRDYQINGTTISIAGNASAGLLNAVAEYVGNYSASLGFGTLNIETESNNGNGLLAKIDLDSLTAPQDIGEGEGTVNPVMSTFYGYIIDLAFRTNEEADLQLQSAPVNRIYADGGNGTAGGGSTATFTYSPAMRESQINKLLAALRVVFFDPDTGEVYGTAKTGDVTVNTESTTAVATLYMTDENGAVTVADSTALTALEFAVPKKISALVYLDGTNIDNMTVINSDNSGTLLLNLQFSSSAELKPMIDDELINAN